MLGGTVFYSAVMVPTPVDRTAEVDVVKLGNKLAELESREVGDNLTEIMQYIGEDEKDLKFRDGTVYIEAFAVQTPRQGQKPASKLMRQLFKELDSQDRDVFLFTNTERNAAIYTHFGFETIKNIRLKSLTQQLGLCSEELKRITVYKTILDFKSRNSFLILFILP